MAMETRANSPHCSTNLNTRLGAPARCCFAIASVLMLLCIPTGCNRSNPYLTATPSGFGGLPTTPQPGQENAAQLAEIERRARLLDENNRQLTTQLAQSQQQMQLYRERSELMQRQLAEVSSQLQGSKLAQNQTSQQARSLAERIENMESAQRRRGGAKLTANTSSKLTGNGIRELGLNVEEDNGVIRVRIPADQLFQSGTAQLSSSASGPLDRIAQVIMRDYPQQRIAIEGHTDNSQLYGGTYTTSHQLAAAQSNAVMEQLTKRNHLPTTQLFTLAHGNNYPIADNDSPAGRSSNRRIEFVIYPDTW
ncbi:MAG: OmpA family protein [Pirellula sp.]|nr:OmpA family protein [Pirellula sp.]